MPAKYVARKFYGIVEVINVPELWRFVAEERQPNREASATVAEAKMDASESLDTSGGGGVEKDADIEMSDYDNDVFIN